MNERKYKLSIGNKDYEAEVKEFTAEFARVVVNGSEYEVKLVDFGRPAEAVPPIPKPAADRPKTAPLAARKPKPSLMVDDSEGVKAPLPGMIVDVLVKEGDTVKAGQDLILMEAMKMENQVQAPHDGTVKKVYVDRGDSVAEDDLLVALVRPLHTTL
jgi:biotin carboxyl carrier protein